MSRSFSFFGKFDVVETAQCPHGQFLAINKDKKMLAVLTVDQLEGGQILPEGTAAVLTGTQTYEALRDLMPAVSSGMKAALEDAAKGNVN